MGKRLYIIRKFVLTVYLLTYVCTESLFLLGNVQLQKYIIRKLFKWTWIIPISMRIIKIILSSSDCLQFSPSNWIVSPSELLLGGQKTRGQTQTKAILLFPKPLTPLRWNKGNNHQKERKGDVIKVLNVGYLRLSSSLS